MSQNTQAKGTRPTLCHAGHQPQTARAGENAGRDDNFSRRRESKKLGATFETLALDFLRRQRLRFVARNVTCRGGEIDLVMREPDGTLVFVEVRARASRRYGGAAASIGWQKRQRIVHAAQFFLASRQGATSCCRFDVVAFEAGRLIWIRDAFRADGT